MSSDAGGSRERVSPVSIHGRLWILTAILSLVEAFSRIQNLRKVRRCLQTFRDGYTRKNLNSSDKTQVEYLANWIRDRMSKALKSIQEVDPQDAAALIEIVKEYDNKIFEEW